MNGSMSPSACAMCIRITLDRSIFHGENFERLLQSPLIAACRSGKYSVYHSSVLIEETLKLLRLPERRAAAEKEIKFLIEIGNGRWFRDPWEIWNGELEGKSKSEYLFLSRNEQKSYSQKMTNGNLTGEFLKRSFDDVDKLKIDDKKDAMKKLFVDLRHTVDPA